MKRSSHLELRDDEDYSLSLIPRHGMPGSSLVPSPQSRLRIAYSSQALIQLFVIAGLEPGTEVSYFLQPH